MVVATTSPSFHLDYLVRKKIFIWIERIKEFGPIIFCLIVVILCCSGSIFIRINVNCMQIIIRYTLFLFKHYSCITFYTFNLISSISSNAWYPPVRLLTSLHYSINIFLNLISTQSNYGHEFLTIFVTVL